LFGVLLLIVYGHIVFAEVVISFKSQWYYASTLLVG